MLAHKWVRINWVIVNDNNIYVYMYVRVLTFFATK
jgi:hypothetical protein